MSKKTDGHFAFSFTPKTSGQKWMVRAFQENDVVFALGPAATGKAQTLDSLIYTPTGPVRMGDIQVGDSVCTPDGGVASVTGVFPQGLVDIYKVAFSDGTSVECCREHLWSVSANDYDKLKDQVVDTSFVMKNLRKSLFVPQTSPVFFERKDVLLSPYVMGALLGDGCFVSSVLGFTSADQEIVDRMNAELPPGHACLAYEKTKYGFRIRRIDSGTTNECSREVARLGLKGLKSYDKFIPDCYLYNSTQNRLDLLNGLLDTDGTASKRGEVTFCTTSPRLAEGVKFLVESLGGICVVSEKASRYSYKGVVKAGKKAYNCYLRLEDKSCLFHLPRKKLLVQDTKGFKVRRFFEYVEYAGKKEAQCISIDAPSRLYLTNNFIVTHNTFCALALALGEVHAARKKTVVYCRPTVECGKGLGFLPGSVEEKYEPYLGPLKDILPRIVYKLPEGVVECRPIPFLRGVTLQDCVVVLDEAQNLNRSELKMLLTRLGTNSKMLVVGDSEQSDIKPTQNEFLTDLDWVVEVLHDVSGVAVVDLPPETVLRHPLVATFTKRL